MKKLITLIIALLFCLSSISFSQITLPGNAYPSAFSTQIVKITVIQKKVEGAPSYDYGVHAIGQEFIAGSTDSTKKIFRTFFEFSLSTIPVNATIQQVTVSFTTGNNSSYTLKLTQITSVGTDKSANWLAVGSGSTLHSAIAYNGSNFISTPIKNAIQSTLANRKIIIGVLSENESTAGSYSAMTLSLDVSYTYPAALLTLQARNDLEGTNGGSIGVGIYPTTAIPQTSPFIFSAYETQRVNLSSYDNQSINNEVWIFNDSEASLNKSVWAKDINGNITNLGSSFSITSPQLTTSDNGASFVAYLKKYCNATFQNSFGSGTIIVEGTSRNSGYSQQVVKLNNISASATRQYNINGLDYIFTQWNDNNTSSSRTFTVDNTQTYTANYTAIPSNIGESLYFNSTIGQPITLHWTDNVNTNVTYYQIWRQVKVDGVWQSPTQLGTVNRGVQQFTDYTYLLNQWRQGIEIQYDVRGYYSVNGNYQDPYWSTVYGQDYKIAQTNEKQLALLNKEIPSGYSINNYPNPFNPSTTISYQLPKSGFVTIKVYDVLGKEVAVLVNEMKHAGYYNVSFDGKDLTSGIYIYSIQTNNYSESRKMLLVK